MLINGCRTINVCNFMWYCISLSGKKHVFFLTHQSINQFRFQKQNNKDRDIMIFYPVSSWVWITFENTFWNSVASHIRSSKKIYLDVSNKLLDVNNLRTSKCMSFFLCKTRIWKIKKGLWISFKRVKLSIKTSILG